jgi:hypothetical protein
MLILSKMEDRGHPPLVTQRPGAEPGRFLFQDLQRRGRPHQTPAEPEEAVLYSALADALLP